MNLFDIIDRFSGVKTLVVGDYMLDRFQYGTVDRISPEAPVPVFRFGSEKTMLGGAGNVAVNLAALGCRVACVGLVGCDPQGRRVAEMLDQHRCANALISLPGYRTTVKTRLIASHNHLLRADQEDLSPDIEPVLDTYLQKIEEHLPQADIVLISDYAKGAVTERTARELIRRCRRANKPVIVDPKGVDYSKYAGAVLVKPNKKEFQEVTSVTIDPTSKRFYQDVARGAKILFDRYGLRHVIVTLSQHGMLHISADKPDSCHQIPTQAREVFDVSGAGDTSFAALGASLGAGADYDDAMAIANIASGIVVGKLGTSSVTADEIREALGGRHPAPENSSHIIPREKITSVLAPWRQRGKTIGFTNGCFDCLHRGHIASFAAARGECDVLVVGVNSDRSVRGYKGPNRPIQDERTRAEIVAALRYVDYVVIFDDPTAESLVEQVHPDVIAKEGYSIDQWPEAQKVVAYGGRAVVLKRLDGVSTTDFIEKLRSEPSSSAAKEGTDA